MFRTTHIIQKHYGSLWLQHAPLQITAGVGLAMAPKNLQAEVKKTEDGKWKVDTGYIDYRTKDPNNLEPRRGTVLDAAAPAGAVVGQSSRDEDGKFKVDTSYINHRTGEAQNWRTSQTEWHILEGVDPFSFLFHVFRGFHVVN